MSPGQAMIAGLTFPETYPLRKGKKKPVKHRTLIKPPDSSKLCKTHKPTKQASAHPSQRF